MLLLFHLAKGSGYRLLTLLLLLLAIFFSSYHELLLGQVSSLLSSERVWTDSSVQSDVSTAANAPEENSAGGGSMMEAPAGQRVSAGPAGAVAGSGSTGISRGSSDCLVCEEVLAQPCVQQLPRVMWFNSKPGGNAATSTTSGTGTVVGREWRWEEAQEKEGGRDGPWEAREAASSQCRGRTEDKEGVLSLLEGHWVVLAGDSQVRESFIALLRLLLPPPSSSPLISSLRSVRHAHLSVLFPPHRLRIDFRFAAYASNITRLLSSFPLSLSSFPSAPPSNDTCWSSTESPPAPAPASESPSCPSHLFKVSPPDEPLPWWPSFPVPNTPNVSSHYFPAPVPSLFLLGDGLWHMLWLTEAALFRRELAELRNATLRVVHLDRQVPRQHNGLKRAWADGRGGVGIGVEGRERGAVDEGVGEGTNGPDVSPFLLPTCPLAMEPAFLWLGLPELIHKRLKDQRKKERMTDGHLAEHNAEILNSGLLLQRPSGAGGRGGTLHGTAAGGMEQPSGVPVGPCWLVDLGALSRGCGESCSQDGVHYSEAVYGAVVQLAMHGVRHLRACGGEKV